MTDPPRGATPGTPPLPWYTAGNPTAVPPDAPRQPPDPAPGQEARPTRQRHPEVGRRVLPEARPVAEAHRRSGRRHRRPDVGGGRPGPERRAPRPPGRNDARQAAPPVPGTAAPGPAPGPLHLPDPGVGR